MKLINVSTLELEDFTLKPKPRYAILSHTWGEDEVTFQDMATAKKVRKKGWTKIVQTCKLARAEGLRYAWVDTCCIDKSSSAELSEAINSMFSWYWDAVICYTYLSDLKTTGVKAIMSCRWWQRGWTLQELLAADRLVFYNKHWRKQGSKRKFSKEISRQTGISKKLLDDRSVSTLRSTSVAKRMSWASHRSTTRVEDEAYCLLGIFDVNMPLIYGEGRKAFRRLQEEIMKQSNDCTILAHRADELLADSSSQFAEYGTVERNNSSFDSEFAITNTGLKLIDRVGLSHWSGQKSRKRFISLELGVSEFSKMHMFRLFLEQTGFQRFQKHPRLKVSCDPPQLLDDGCEQTEPLRFLDTTFIVGMRITLQPNSETDQDLSQSSHRVYVSLPTTLILIDTVPREDFDFESMFFTLGALNKAAFLGSSMRILQMQCWGERFIAVVKKSGNTQWVHLAFVGPEHDRIYQMLFSEWNAKSSASWKLLKRICADCERSPNTLTVRTLYRASRIEAHIEGDWESSGTVVFRVSDFFGPED